VACVNHGTFELAVKHQFGISLMLGKLGEMSGKPFGSREQCAKEFSLWRR